MSADIADTWGAYLDSKKHKNSKYAAAFFALVLLSAATFAVLSMPTTGASALNVNSVDQNTVDTQAGTTEVSANSGTNDQVNVISGLRFVDANGDGLKGADETGTAGETITISNGDVSLSTVTDENGNYEFTGVADGTYSLCEVLTQGWEQTVPSSGVTCGDSTGYQIVVSGSGSLGNNFGNKAIVASGSSGTSPGRRSSGGGGGGSSSNSVQQSLVAADTGSISGTKFLDMDKDGVQDSNEPGLPQFTITLTGTANASTTTDSTGHYGFQNLPVGTYTVLEVQQAGWTQTTANPGLINLSNNQVGNVNFGNAFSAISECTTLISGMKFNDLNGNGTKDTGEAGLANWNITITGPVNMSTLTDANGNYRFVGVPSGTYTVREVQQDNWQQTTADPAPQTVVVSCATGVNFGNQLKIGSISGIKFKDLNGDGVRGTNEPGMFGWNITLTGPVSETTLTGANGEFTFANLPPGVYTVREIQQAGWTQTTADPAQINLSGQNITNVMFGNSPLLSSISGMKFEDINGNGIKDGNETGLANWTITMSGTLNVSALTADDGTYKFANLTSGTYTVREIQQEGWLQTSADPATITLVLGQNVAGVNFGNQKVVLLNSVSGMKFDDANANGVRDENETGIANWTITISGNATELSTVTDNNGNYEFTGLVGGSYTVCETLQAGWVQTYPVSGADCTNGKGHTMSLSDGAGSVNNNFGNTRRQNSISGIKFKDLNGNGIRDGNEPGMFGWVIYLDANNNSVLDSGEVNTTTDGNGAYSFTNLTAGTYYVREVQQEGWSQTTTNPAPITVIAGNDITGVNFGNSPFPRGSISGFKWEDINHNKKQDPGEGRISGWTIYLDTNGNNQLDSGEVSTITDANGEYTFANLAAGTYNVREVQVEGWIQITPNPAAVVITSAAEHITGVNFGNQNFGATNTISGMKFNDANGNGARDTGEVGLANWTIYLDTNVNGVLDSDEDNTLTDANGNYEFTNMLPGTYNVREVQQPSWTQTTANPAPIAVSSASVVTGVNFGNHHTEAPLNSVSGMKFNDANGNGVQDEGEVGLANWTITIAGTETGTSTVTDSDGNYEFTGLVDDTYTVCEVLQEGWTQTFPETGAECAGGTTGYTLEVSDGAGVVNNNFGNMQVPKVASISGMKFEDVNSNGVKDVGENGLANWSIFLDANANGLLDGGEVNTQTDATGAYVFADLQAGTYIVREVQQSGWTQTTANPALIALVPGQDVTGVNFGNHKIMGSISGYKWEDINHNKKQDPGEGRIAGWTIYLDANGNDQLDGGEVSTTTDANGTYTFTVVPGVYNVREEVREGWIQITSNPGPKTITGAGESITGVNFGNQNVAATNAISGVKFNDANGNGAKDSGEAGLAGWTVYLDSNSNDVLDVDEDNMTTDANGNYEFTNLLPGTYNVREVQQAGFIQTTTNPAPITLVSADVVNGVNFGSQATSAQEAVSLGTAGGYVILTKSGITNTGSHISDITGDVGSSPITAAAMDNVFCSEITGTIYGSDAAYTGSGDVTCFAGTPADNTLVAGAVLDMETAYTTVAGLTGPDSTELGAGNIGGMTLAPGLYKWSTDVTIPTDVTLSGGASDVWIFQISGNLDIASAKKVILSGGAQAKNVFWQVGGVTGATLGTTSTFNGNILSAKQVIIQTGATLNGRALAQTQTTLDASTVTMPV